MHSFKIKKSLGSSGSIAIDGKELLGVFAVEVEISVTGADVVTVHFYAKDLEIEIDAELELNGRGRKTLLAESMLDEISREIDI